MALYDTLPSKAEADTFLATYVNSQFPKVEGNYRADKWVEESIETLDGRGVWPIIPQNLLDYWNVPQAQRDGYKAALLAAGGEYHVELTENDFPQPDIPQ